MQKWQMLEILGAPVPTCLDWSMPNLACLSWPTVYTYPPNFIWFDVFCFRWESKNLKFYRFFPTLSFCHGFAQRCRDKVECECTCTNISYPTIPRSFPNFNALMAKWHSQTFKSWRTNKQRLNFFSPVGMRYPSPTKLIMVIEEVHTFLVPPKYIRLWLSFAARGHWKFGVTHTPELKPT